MKWWTSHKFRMIQNNLRDIDGRMDVDYEIAMLKKFHANVVQVGCGGISAFSKTNLECQMCTPYLQGDKFGELLQKCHDNGIRVIARFDVSKVHQSFEEKNPEWMQRTAQGLAVHYNDTVLTCVNSSYQQEKTVEIISEILQKYPVDGIFFNMFGYQTYDYSGRYIGICQCENCRRRFKEQYGQDLPTAEDTQDPVYQNYQKFKQETVDELLKKIASAVKTFNPDIALSTYFDKEVDIIRCESNTAVDRPLPMWIYSASDNVSCLEGTFGDKVSSNCAINAVDIPFRFMGVSDTYNQIRMYENIGNGGNLDWCVIGSFEDYPDRSNYGGVEKVFGFHKAYENLFHQMRSAAKVLLIQPVPPYVMSDFSPEYRGIFKILKESHITFDTLIDIDTEEYQNQIEDYSLIIVPGIPRLKSGKIRDALLKSEAKVMGTAGSFSEDPELLKKYFDITELKRQEGVRAAYYLTEPKNIFKSFPDQDWIYQDGDYWTVKEDEVQADDVVLPYLSPSTFGPPERCFGHKVTSVSGVVMGKKGVSIHFEPGRLYYRHGYEAFKYVFLDLMDAVIDREKMVPFTTDAHSSMEILYHQIDENKALMQFINLSGFNGVTITRPIAQKDIHIRLNRTPIKVEELKESETGYHEAAVEGNTFTIDECDIHKAYLIRY